MLCAVIAVAVLSGCGESPSAYELPLPQSAVAADTDAVIAIDLDEATPERVMALIGELVSQMNAGGQGNGFQAGFMMGMVQGMVNEVYTPMHTKLTDAGVRWAVVTLANADAEDERDHRMHLLLQGEGVKDAQTLAEAVKMPDAPMQLTVTAMGEGWFSAYLEGPDAPPGAPRPVAGSGDQAKADLFSRLIDAEPDTALRMAMAGDMAVSIVERDGGKLDEADLKRFKELAGKMQGMTASLALGEDWGISSLILCPDAGAAKDVLKQFDELIEELADDPAKADEYQQGKKMLAAMKQDGRWIKAKLTGAEIKQMLKDAAQGPE
jgi:hypothetical protein